MDRTTTIALMAATLAAPRKGDYAPSWPAEEAARLYGEVTLITRPLDGATVVGVEGVTDDEAPHGRCKKCGDPIDEQEARTGGYHIGGCP